MKIIMVEPFGKGGICHYTFNLCNSLSTYVDQLILITAINYEVELIPTKFTLIKILRGMNNQDSKPIRMFKALINPILLFIKIKKYKPNYVHFQSSFIPIFDILLIKIIKIYKIKIIFTAHEIRFSTSRGSRFLLDYFLEKILISIYKNADIIIVHSNYAKAELMKMIKNNNKKILKMSHGVQDINLFGSKLNYAQCLMDLGLNNSDFHALFFGSLRYSKGLDLLLMSLPKIVKEIHNFKLLVAGPVQSTTNVDFLMNLVETFGLDERNIKFDIRYIPMQDVHKYFTVCSFVILPYRENYQSGVLSTAYAFGKPVIASAAGDFIEHVHDGLTGYILNDISNTELLSEKVIDLASNKILLAKMSEEAEKYGRINLSWETISQKLYSSL